MNVVRGEIVLAEFPFSTGASGKIRPVLIIQDDFYNQRLQNVLVALLTTNLRNARDRAHFLIKAASADGLQSGLTLDSVVSCNNLATIHKSRLRQSIGRLSTQSMANIENCLKAAMGLS